MGMRTAVFWPPVSDGASYNKIAALAAHHFGTSFDLIYLPYWDFFGDAGSLNEADSAIGSHTLKNAYKLRPVSMSETGTSFLREIDPDLFVIHDERLPVGGPKISARRHRASRKIEWIEEGSNSEYYFIGRGEEESADGFLAATFLYHDQPESSIKALHTHSKAVLKQMKTDLPKGQKINIFGTGPSLSETFDNDYSNDFNFICNTIVKDRDFIKRNRPKLIVASDAHFHFSIHQYTKNFFDDLAWCMDYDAGAVFVTFDKFAFKARAMLPEFSDRIIGIPAGRKSYGYTLEHTFAVYPAESVVNMFMLPIASYLGDDISLHGFTGRSESDSYFWAHSDRVQYVDQMAAVRTIHPAFFKDRDFKGYSDTVGEQIHHRIKFGERKSKSFSMETTTFYPQLQKAE